MGTGSADVLNALIRPVWGVPFLCVILITSSYAQLPTYQVTEIGLTGANYGSQSIHTLTNSNKVAGITYRYENYQFLGQDAWIWNGVSTIRVGLIGSAYESPISGYRESAILKINEAGQLAGNARIYDDEGYWGSASWVYNGTNNVRVGLYGEGYVRPITRGNEYSELQYFNELGMAAGVSEAYQPLTETSWLQSERAWFYDGDNTIRVGFTGTEYTYSNGRQISRVSGLNNQGELVGWSYKTDNNGADAWIYRNGVTTRIGLTASIYGGAYRLNRPDQINESGAVLGRNYDGNDIVAWVYDGHSTTQIGLTGADYFRDDGSQNQRGFILNESGYISGSAERFSGSTHMGFATWAYDGTTTYRVGLTGSTFTRDDGYQRSDVWRHSEQGNYVAGISKRYSGSAEIGQSAWVNNGQETVEIGLVSEEFTGSDGYQFHRVDKVNNSGQVAGTSIFSSIEPDPTNSTNSGAAWFYDGAETRRIGLYDQDHTRGDGRQNSYVVDLNDSGQLVGYSSRYFGITPWIYEDEWGGIVDETPSLGRSSWFYNSETDQLFDLTMSVRASDNYASSIVRYLGDDGLVLGEYELFAEDGSTLGSRIFYFTEEEGLFDLGDLSIWGNNDDWSSLSDQVFSNDSSTIALAGSNSPAYLLTVTTVPVPAAVWLFGSAIGLLGLARRKVP